MLAFTRASKAFFDAPRGLCRCAPADTAPVIVSGGEGQEARTARLLSLASALDEISLARPPNCFHPCATATPRRSFLDRFTADMDVDLIHRGYLRMFRARGGRVLLSAPLTAASRSGSQWQVRCGSEDLMATTIINAAGAWGDVCCVTLRRKDPWA